MIKVGKGFIHRVSEDGAVEVLDRVAIAEIKRADDFSVHPWIADPWRAMCEGDDTLPQGRNAYDKPYSDLLLFPSGDAIMTPVRLVEYARGKTVKAGGNLVNANHAEIREVFAAWRRGEPVADRLLAMGARIGAGPNSQRKINGIIDGRRPTLEARGRLSAAPFGWPSAASGWPFRVVEGKDLYAGNYPNYTQILMFQIDVPGEGWVIAGVHSEHEAWADGPGAAEWLATLPPATDPKPRSVYDSSGDTSWSGGYSDRDT